MQKGRQLISLAMGALLAAGASSAASISQAPSLSKRNEDGLFMPTSMGQKSNFKSANRQPPGAHMAAHRAAHKLRRVKKARRAARG